MENYRQYLNPQTLASLKGLGLKARRIVEGYVAGLHKSPFHGFSVEFAEHREYVPGDDLRYVDWKVYGKRDRIYLKEYEEETNFACYLLLDTSESMRYRSDKAAVSKLEYAKYVAAALAYVVLRQQDAVGLVTFNTKVDQFLPASNQPSHLKPILHILEQSRAAGETTAGPILHDLAERIKKRGLVIILSDLFDDTESLRLGLKHFHYRRHDVIVMQIIDPAEQDFPFEDPTLFKGLEGLPDRLADPRSVRDAYQQEFEGYLTSVRRVCRDLHMDHVLLRSDTSLDVALSTFLSSRTRLRRPA